MTKLSKIFFTSLILIITGFLILPTISQAKEINYSGPVKDSDYDGLTDQGETQLYNTDPLKADSDGDGYLDGAEILAGTDPTDKSNALTPTPSAAKEIPWPWYISRSSAIVGYLLLFLLIISGISIKTSLIFKIMSPTIAWVNHRLIGYSLSLSVLIHIAALYFDNYSKFTITNLLVPFSSDFKPLYLSLGILGFYLLIIIIVTSIFHIDKYPVIWRNLHYLTYLVFFTIAIHGFFTGTDSSSIVMQVTYATTGIIAASFILYRLYFTYRQIK